MNYPTFYTRPKKEEKTNRGDKPNYVLLTLRKMGKHLLQVLAAVALLVGSSLLANEYPVLPFVLAGCVGLSIFGYVWYNVSYAAVTWEVWDRQQKERIERERKLAEEGERLKAERNGVPAPPPAPPTRTVVESGF